MLGVGIGIGVNRFRAGASYPAVLDDGNTVAWFDSAENITKNGADLVSAWGDKSGLNHHLLQAGSDAIKPLWSNNGVLFDGADDYLKTAPFTLEQPEQIYAVLRQVTWTNFDRIWDGNGTDDGMLYQNSTTPGLKASAGTPSSQDSNLTPNTFGIIKVLFNGGASKFQVNGNTIIEGDFGAIDLAGFTLGARGNGANNANVEVKEIIIRKIADTGPNYTIIDNYLKNKYSL